MTKTFKWTGCAATCPNIQVAASSLSDAQKRIGAMLKAHGEQYVDRVCGGAHCLRTNAVKETGR